MRERRDPRRRGQLVAALVGWLRAQSTPVPAVPPDVAPPDAAARVLRRLAARALVRRVEAGWVAGPALRHPVPVVEG